jgi:UTP--glucose-1-phosphate uridylyltransferase
MIEVTKAVIPAAGLGTRLSPLTRHMAKELLPIGGKPMIQHHLEMCMAGGIEEFCVIISPRKVQLKDFVTGEWTPPALPFEKDLRFYDRIKRCRVTFLTQLTPSGVADAVGLAKAFVGQDPFVCIMPDCILFSDRPSIQQLLPAFQRHGTNVVGTILITGMETRRFGNVGILSTQDLDEECFRITSLSGKTSEPLPVSPGKTICKGFGGGIYLPEYFDLIEEIHTRAGNEVDDVPIHQILVEQDRLLGVVLQGAAFDAGHPLGLRAAAHYVGRSGECIG